MSEAERASRIQALEQARNALGDCPELESQKASLTKEIERQQQLEVQKKELEELCKGK